MKVGNNIHVVIIYYIILTLIANIDSKNVRFQDLSLGDIVDVDNLNELSNEVYGHVFNGYDNAEFSHEWGEKRAHNIAIFSKKICLDCESALTLYFPKIFVNSEKFSKNVFETKIMRDLFFSKNWTYINSKDYSFGIIKVCKNIHVHHMKIKMIEKNETLKIDDSKYYVSNAIKGRCLFQIFVNNIDFCDKTNDKDQFFNSSIFKTRIATSDEDHTIDDLVNNYFTNQHSLSSFKTLPLKNRSDIFNILQKDIIVDLHFHSLPKLIELPENHHKSLIRHELMINLQPGDMINVDDLFNFNDSLLGVDSLSVEKKNYLTSPMTSFTYENCSISKQNFKKLWNYYPEVQLFDRFLEQKSYGVGPEYLDTHKCLKILICNSLRVSELKKSVKVININKEKKMSHYKLFFNREDIVIRSDTGNATHFITKVKKGDCLFQALMFPASENINETIGYENPGSLLNSLVYSGEIISASDNRTLEIWVKNFINNLSSTVDKSLGLINLLKNTTNLFSILRELNHNEALISLQLHPLN